jgi:hypothetical protein
MATTNSLIHLLNETMLGDEQQHFCKHFSTYLHNDSKRDFVIDLDAVVEWLGLANKTSAAGMVVHHLQADVHYKVAAVDTASSSTSTRVRLSVNGFKQLCQVADTAEANRALEYFLAMEGVMLEYTKQLARDAARSASRATAERDAIQKMLEAERLETQRKLCRTFGGTEHKGQFTYIFKDSADPASNVYTVGQTKDLAAREQVYSVHNHSGRFLHTRSCLNQRLLEKVAHHMLDEFRIMRDREWFDCHFEIIKEVLDTAQAFIDGFVNNCRAMCESGRAAAIRDIMAINGNTENSESSESTENSESSVRAESSERTESSELAVDESVASEDDEDDDDVDEEDDEDDDYDGAPVPVNAMDFQEFLRTCCEVRDGAWAFATDVVGCHRMWARCCSKTCSAALRTFFKSSFRTIKQHDPTTGASLIAFRGVAVKPFAPLLDVATDVGRFVVEACNVGYVLRASTRSLITAFEAWKRSSDGDVAYVANNSEKQRFEKSLAQSFWQDKVFTGEGRHYGFFGVAPKMLKENARKDVGLKLNPKAKKRVMLLDMANGVIAQEFDSLTACARYLKVLPSALCTDMRYRRPRGQYIAAYCTDPDVTVGSKIPAHMADPPQAGDVRGERPKLPAGVNYVSRKPGCKLRADIRHKGVSHCLGTFDTVEDAQAAYQAAKAAVELERNGGPAAPFGRSDDSQS